MTVKLTPEYIESLVDKEEFLVQPEIIICKLTVGESVFTGEAHCFDTAVQNVPRGKESARRHAINKIFDAEAYHLKRERDKLNRKHGIHMLPIYRDVRDSGGCIRLLRIVTLEDFAHRDEYHFDYVNGSGALKHIVVDVDVNSGRVDLQLQSGLRIMCLEGQSENTASQDELRWVNYNPDLKYTQPTPRTARSLAEEMTQASFNSLPVVKEVERQGGKVVLLNATLTRYTIAITDLNGKSHIQYIDVDIGLEKSVDEQLESEVGLRCLGHGYKPQPIKGDRTHVDNTGNFSITMSEQNDGSLKVTRVVENPKGEPEVSPSDYKGDGGFSGSGASGTWGDKEETVQTTVRESTTSHHDHHTHNHSNHSSPSENHSSNDSGGSCSSD